jgi:hypothetical protein
MPAREADRVGGRVVADPKIEPIFPKIEAVKVFQD